jgi:hypothetical protein
MYAGKQLDPLGDGVDLRGLLLMMRVETVREAGETLDRPLASDASCKDPARSCGGEKLVVICDASRR